MVAPDPAEQTAWPPSASAPASANAALTCLAGRAQREMARAAEAGVVGSRRLGSTRLVAADSPLTGPLTESVAGVDAVYLFGSWAARYAGQRGRAPADIDVLVIGRPDRHELDEAVQARSRLIRKCAPHPLVREVKRCWSGRLI